MLDDLGITAAIEWQAEELQKRTGVKCELMLGSEDITLDQARSTAIFHIFQEALTNVARHAKATSVKASLKEKDGNLVLQVIDDGVGITEEQISDPKSLGLIEMRERVYPFGGMVKISGIPGKGTAVTASIPLGSGGENG
jgi:signal transduction histidine kinase